MKNKPFRLFPSTIAASFILLTPALQAAITWDGLGVGTNWSTPENWDPDTADVSNEFVTFSSAGAAAPATTTNTVDADATISSLSYSFEDAANQHTTAIAAGVTLDVTGDFVLAGADNATVATNVTITGSPATTETLTVGGSSFQVGQTTPVSGTANNSLDMSGLDILTANLGGSGIFRLGAASGATAGALATVRLAATNTITADILGVGDRAGRGGLHTLKLGGTANTINANNIYVGPSGSGGRGNGELLFDSGTGTLQLRAADGTAAVTAMNLISTSFGTANNLTATANFAGHDVNAKITALTMGKRSSTGTAASATATFTFDTGTLEVGTLNIAENAQAASTSGAINATMNIGGGTASFTSATTAITMASSVGGAATTTAATLNLTGGTTTVNGDIVKVGGGLGTTTANLTLNGASTILDMTGDDLTNLTSITYTDGLLKNLGIVNTGMTLAGSGSRIFDQGVGVSGIIQGAITGTGVGLTKQGPGTLTLSGTNTYDGATAINDGVLVFVSKNAKTSAPATATATETTVGSIGLGVSASDSLYYSAADIGSLFNSNSLTGFNLDPASGVGIDTTNAGGSFTQSVALTANRALTKTGTGTLVLPGANAFTGNVQIIGIANSNTLRIEHAEALGPIATAKNITLTGVNRQVSILELANNITVDINKTINTSGKSPIATGESALGSQVFLRSASGNNKWLGNILINAAGGGYAIEAAADTLTLGDPATASVLRNDVLGSTRAINFLGGGNVVVNSRFVDTDGSTSTGINKHGTGTLTLSRTDNQGTLATPVLAVGTTVVQNMTVSGAQSSIGSGTSFNFGGTFRHAGAANSSSNRAFGLVGPTPTLESSGAGTLALTNTTPVAFVNGTGSPVAPFGLGVSVVTVRDAFTLFPGMTIAGTGIASSTKITAVNYDTREVTLDKPTTAAQALAVGGTISGTANLDRTFTLGGTNTGDNLIAAPIANPSGTGKLALTKADAGKWILTGASTYTGNTTVNAGTLLVNSPGSLAAASAVAVNGGTLGGNGTVGGTVTVAAAGSVAPGASAGTLTISGGLDISAPVNGGAGKLKFELDSLVNTNDKIAVTGTLTIGSGALGFSDFVFTNLGGLQATGATPYKLITSGGISGSLNAANLSGSLGGGLTGTLQVTGNDIELVVTGGVGNYASWAASQIPPVTGGENGDSDNDGVKNLVEYALVNGGERGVFDTNTNTITFTKRTDAITNGDVKWIIETSETLLSNSWTDAVTQNAGNATPTISYTFTPGSPVKKFARLKVITTP
jgi:autotransporter-associated beta strand protein